MAQNASGSSELMLMHKVEGGSNQRADCHFNGEVFGHKFLKAPCFCIFFFSRHAF